MPVQNYIDGLRDLPVMPEVAAKVLAFSEGGNDMSFRDLEAVIKADAGLTAKILKIANSALYARQREIKSLQMAITLLGFKNIKNVVMLVSASRLFPRLQKSTYHVAHWRHSLLSAFLARMLAGRSGRPDVAEELFLCGLLHDIGRAVLYSADPDGYERVLAAEKLGAMLAETLEEQVMGVNHRAVGGEVLSRWNFPSLYVDTALEHETLNIASPHKTLVILVSVASILADRISDGAVSPQRRELFQALAPYTPVPAAEIDAPAEPWNTALHEDPLFQEYQVFFGIT
jgi:putative nucleotidyltransferase with HDIG domain